jgi:FtsH-binding integral membrane protein
MNNLNLASRLTLAYVVIGVLLFMATVQKPIFTSAHPLGLFIAGILCIILLFRNHPTSSFNTAINHVLWVVFILILSATLHGYARLHPTTTRRALISVSIFVVALMLLSPHLGFVSGWGEYLFWGLIALIIARLLVPESSLYGIFGIVLFALFVVYDTRRLQKTAIADWGLYPRQSLGLILDFVNLVTSVLQR